MLEFHFELSKEDYYEFNKHHTYHTPVNKRLMLRSRIMYPLIYLIGAILFVFVFQDIDSRLRFTLTVYFTALALLRLIFFNKLVDRRIKKAIARSAQDGRLFDDGPRTYRFEASTFTCTTKNQIMNSAYSELERVDVGKQAVYLYEGALKSHIFPNYVFAGEEEKNLFVSFIREKISESKEENKG